jgi:hypothetical protein
VVNVLIDAFLMLGFSMKKRWNMILKHALDVDFALRFALSMQQQ